MLEGITQKYHDESRQGEALMIENKVDKAASRKLYIESYGCQMNFADSEVVASIMLNNDFQTTNDFNEADVIFINTCSIRENAELRIRKRLTDFKAAKRAKPGMIVGVLGCMAERLKSKFLEEEKLVDIVVGPDAYRDLPNLIQSADDGQKAVNVLLSRDETYGDISPIRLNTNGVSAFVSITRGCDNMCSFCVVPFTRGRERSRDPQSIIEEIKDLFEKGFREVTLLGQNVDSYEWENDTKTEKVTFANLLALAAQVKSEMRIRFSTSHPKDLTDDVLYTMRDYENICKSIHLPVQSGNTRILDLMNRTYSREWYINRIDAIRNILPGCTISTDIIAGFCSETEEEHQETLSMMDYVKYDFAYMFSYSERPGTPAAKKLKDDVSDEVKARRLAEIVALQRAHSLERMKEHVGKTQKVLIEGFSKKSDNDFAGRSDQNAMVVFPVDINYKKGDYVNVLIVSCTSATLIGKIIE
ncbi:MAG: tRNA (N6-isopentenyl adenosine(37)-C2)-methylthiotransferase MiaB [bacterium]|jgi:tRNA-2-methylthio-N6-dimethylallyladenosine synthase